MGREGGVILENVCFTCICIYKLMLCLMHPHLRAFTICYVMTVRKEKLQNAPIRMICFCLSEHVTTREPLNRF
jgi:hypothetical protein